MSRFADDSVSAALDRSIRNAKHLRAKDAAAVAAARALAKKIDVWDVIVDWAWEDAAGEGRPKVPQNDNVSLASFLKYMEALGLVPSSVKGATGGKRGPAKNPLDAWRDKQVG